MPLDIIELEEERWQWSSAIFNEATPEGSLSKCKGEIKEIEFNLFNGIRDPVEYADAIMCLFDAARREGILPEEILRAYAWKTQLNKNRTWIKHADNSYSHVKPLTPETCFDASRCVSLAAAFWYSFWL